MSQLYLYSNIWIYIWSIFSQVGQYFTYLIYTVNWWSVCGNYLSCDPESYSPQLWGQGGALKRGIIQTVRFAYQNMAGRLYTPFHLDYQWNSSWLAPGSLVGKHYIGRPSLRASWLAELRQRRRRDGSSLVGSEAGWIWSVCCVAVSKFWKVVSSQKLKTERSKAEITFFFLLILIEQIGISS